MKNLITTTLLLLLSVSLPSVAQTLTVTDDSPSDSPIRFKGTVTWDSAGNTTCAYVLHDFSSKIVVAWREDIDASFPNGGSAFGYGRHDHFFKDPDMLTPMSAQPGTDSETYIPCAVFSTSLGQSSKAPGIQITTYWVQFIDGSTWGTPDARSYMMAERNNALQFLNKLSAAYASGGQAAFDLQLAGPLPQRDEFNEANNAKFELQALPGMPARLAEVNRRLAVAASRANWMK